MRRGQRMCVFFIGKCSLQSMQGVCVRVFDRNNYLTMSVASQQSLLEVMAQATSATPSFARTHPGAGPGLILTLKRVIPLPPALQPVRLTISHAGRLTLTGAHTGGGARQHAATSPSPFIFSAAVPGKRNKGVSHAGAQEAGAGVMEWVSDTPHTHTHIYCPSIAHNTWYKAVE